MARIRYLKPEFFSDEDLAELPFQTRLTFAGLWCYADREGRLEDRPKYLKAMIFPYDNVDMDKQLKTLSNGKHENGVPFIQRYEAEGKQYIQILSWKRHQNPHHTERQSTFPPTPPLKDKDKDKYPSPKMDLINVPLTVKDPLKSKYGEFSNVYLTESEYKKLIDQFGEKGAKSRIENLSTGIESKGYKYKSHYATILSWERKNPGPIKEESEKNKPVLIECKFCHKIYNPKEEHQCRN